MSARPTMYDKNVIELVCQEIMPKIIDWLKQSGESDEHIENEREFIKADVIEALEYCHLGGYSSAQCLDRKGWMPDAGLVEIFDDAIVDFTDAIKDLTREWVKLNGVTTTLNVGDIVTFKSPQKSSEHVTGEITKIFVDEARCLVYSEQLGHVKTGPGSYGVYLPYEQLQLVAKE